MTIPKDFSSYNITELAELFTNMTEEIARRSIAVHDNSQNEELRELLIKRINEAFNQ